jgi:hypothetical protein
VLDVPQCDFSPNQEVLAKAYSANRFVQLHAAQENWVCPELTMLCEDDAHFQDFVGATIPAYDMGED